MKLPFILFLISTGLFANAQTTRPAVMNDIFLPELLGQVKCFTEFTIAGSDTLQVFKVCYTQKGIRSSQLTASKHPEMGFTNDTTCYKMKEKELVSVGCRNDSKKNTTISFGDNGLVNQVDMEYPDQVIHYMPEYDDQNRLSGINTARSKDKTFQFFATLNYTYNKAGLIMRSSAEGGNLPGKTEYSYSKNLLVKTVRSGYNGAQTFTIDYEQHDSKGNWTLARTVNGVTVTRIFEYF